MEPVGQQANEFVTSPVGQGLLSDQSLWFRLTTPEGAYLFVSPQVEQFLGYEPEEFLELDPRTVIHPDEIQVAGEAIQALRDGPINAIYRMRHKNGDFVWVSSHLQWVDGMVLTLGRTVPERLQGISWHHVEPFL